MIAVGKNIIIKDTQEKTTKTEGGLILAEKQREDIRYQEAEVLTPGSEVTLLKKGDKIFYDKHAALKVDIEGKVFSIIKEQDIVIIL
jgi:co-chaperonin GroES (HSP10)